MKRLIPASIIFICAIILCIVSHTAVRKECYNTLKDVDNFCSHKISAKTLENNWKERKEKMSLFVNHAFLDDLTIYIGQLSLYDSTNEKNDIIVKNIYTTISMIQTEQELSAHSFY